MAPANNHQTEWQINNNKRSRNLVVWTFIWVLSSALLAFGPKVIWDYNTTLSLIAVGVNLTTGGIMLTVNRTYLINLDELQRKIYLEAMALCLGVGLIVGLCYESLEDIKLISFEPQIAHLTFIMCFAFMLGLIKGHRKYK